MLALSDAIDKRIIVETKLAQDPVFQEMLACFTPCNNSLDFSRTLFP